MANSKITKKQTRINKVKKYTTTLSITSRQYLHFAKNNWWQKSQQNQKRYNDSSDNEQKEQLLIYFILPIITDGKTLNHTTLSFEKTTFYNEECRYSRQQPK